MRFPSNWRIYWISLSWLVFFHQCSKLQNQFLFLRKISKWDYSNYRSISLLLNIEKILEKRMYKRLYSFLNNSNIIYNSKFGFRRQYSTCHTLALFSMRGGAKRPSRQFFPCNSTNVGISPQNFLTFSFHPFATLV